LLQAPAITAITAGTLAANNHSQALLHAATFCAPTAEAVAAGAVEAAATARRLDKQQQSHSDLLLQIMR
jgi:hypothetical protein